MDVHYHPEEHHKNNGKKISEYLKEGLMIFLAVFLGFIAENIREHISDSKKEEEYAISMLRDLRQDSLKLNDIMQAHKMLAKGRDSLINLLSDSTGTPGFGDRAYSLFFKYGTSQPIFNATDRTITQLTSSGNFRLIENRAVADSIAGYYDNIKDAGTQAALNNTVVDDCFQYAQNIFKFRYGIKPHIHGKALLTSNGNDITRYVNKLTEMQISEQYYINKDLRDVNKSCIKLMQLLKKEYGIK